jgi:hypothetical protein
MKGGIIKPGCIGPPLPIDCCCCCMALSIFLLQDTEIFKRRKKNMCNTGRIAVSNSGKPSKLRCIALKNARNPASFLGSDSDFCETLSTNMVGMVWRRGIATLARRSTLRQAAPVAQQLEERSMLRIRRNLVSPCMKPETSSSQSFPKVPEKFGSGAQRVAEDSSCVTPCESTCNVTLPPDMCCWACQKARKSSRCADNLFCESCGNIQPPAPKCNYFDLLGMKEEKYDINLKELEEKYKNLIRRLHPDLFMQKNKQELEFSQVRPVICTTSDMIARSCTCVQRQVARFCPFSPDSC